MKAWGEIPGLFLFFFENFSKFFYFTSVESQTCPRVPPPPIGKLKPPPTPVTTAKLFVYYYESTISNQTSLWQTESNHRWCTFAPSRTKRQRNGRRAMSIQQCQCFWRSLEVTWKITQIHRYPSKPEQFTSNPTRGAGLTCAPQSSVTTAIHTVSS